MAASTPVEVNTATDVARYGTLRNYVGGALVDVSGPTVPVHDPATGAVIAHVPMSGTSDVDAAVSAARAALPAWRALTMKDRVQVLYRYRTLVEQHLDELSQLIVDEHGKVMAEARAEWLKVIELTEFACSLPQIATGSVMEVSRGVECRTERTPVGVVASIVPFNPKHGAALDHP